MVQGLTIWLMFSAFRQRWISLVTPQSKWRKQSTEVKLISVWLVISRSGKWVDEIGKLEDHILRTHIPPERIPFFSQLCKFKCLRQEQLIRHVTHYARHVSMAAGRGIIDHGPYLCRSQNPYQVTEMDYFKLSQEASLKYFLEKSAPTGRASSVDASITKLVNGTLEGEITQETLRAGFINLGAHQPEAASVQANGPTPMTAFRPVMLELQVQPNQWRQHSRYQGRVA